MLLNGEGPRSTARNPGTSLVYYILHIALVVFYKGEGMAESVFGMTGKNVLIVGGGQGMGEASARLAAEQGANVAILDMDLGRAEAVASKLADLGVATTAITADVTDPAQLTAAIAKASDDLGVLDGMVCIVGMASWASLIDMPLEVWDIDHQRNLRYFFVAAQDVARRAIAAGKGCSIVSLTSVDGVQSAPFHGAYGAAKAGLISVTKTMAAEWTEFGVRVNTIAPGAIVSPRIPRMAPEEERERYNTIPARRRGDADDVARAALFLLSDLSTYVSGATLPVDGGFLAVGPVNYAADAAKAGANGTLDAVGVLSSK
jgi:NAD(P)-dependent dehydrogenase (short-subunit alcohol dehydrogenase family)